MQPMERYYYPPRRRGILFHSALLLVLFAGSTFSLARATDTPIGDPFWISLAGFAGLALPIPILLYRLYGLLRGRYVISASQVRLMWGLREEVIPMLDINWVQAETDLIAPLHLPLLRWPGAVTGRRRYDRRRRVEFLAATTRNLVIVETSRVAYAISPEDPQAFLEAFRHVTEIGTLSQVPGSSVHPVRLIGSAWHNRSVRWMISAAFTLAAALALWIVLVVRPQPGVSLQLAGTGRQVTSAQLYLLPVLNGAYFLVDLFLGLFFFRRPETTSLAYLLWASSILASLLLGLAALLLLNSAPG